MSRERSALAGIDGLPVDEAVDAVVAADATRNAEAVRRAFDHVTDDGVVTAEAFDETVSDVSKVVSTAETRTELAEIEYEDAAEAADPHADVATVAARLDEFAAELDEVTADAEALSDRLQAAIADPDDAVTLFETLEALRDVASEAQSVQLAADRLQADLESFGRWVSDHETRADAYAADVDAAAEMLDGLADDIEELAAVVADGSADDPAVAWFDAALRHRVTGLLLSDLRAELVDLRTLAERSDSDDDALAAFGGRLDGFHARREEVAVGLDELALPAWRERYDDELAAFEAELDELEPPVPWGSVQRTLDARRPDGPTVE